MGLHQKITSRTESVPCDCGADDDHGEVVRHYPFNPATGEEWPEGESEDVDVTPLDEEEDVRPHYLDDLGEPNGFTTT